jgi:23S rRNA pseudouridine1911/1915/1917 synthase
MRVDRFVVEHVAHTSRTKVQEAADAGNILINGVAVKSSTKVKPGDVITVMMSYPRREEEIIPEDIPIDIVYEDDDVLVVNKAAGMCVHPGFGNMTGTLVNALAYHLRGLPMFADKADMRPGLVHRIDKDTSGLLVVAKTESAKMDLAAQFFKKTTERTYVALVWGTPDPKNGTIVGNIGRSVRDRKVMDVYPEDSGIGKHAVTHYETIEPISYVSLVRCRLETGRTHQIRAHMRHIGHPLFADAHYGGDVVLRGQNNGQYRQFVGNLLRDFHRQALHAQTLGFRHPRTGEMMRFGSEIASDMTECIERWRKYAMSI